MLSNQIQHHALAYYAKQSPYTDFGSFSNMLHHVPDSIEAMCQYVRNVIEHFHGVNAQSIRPSRLLNVDIRHNKGVLEKIQKAGYEHVGQPIAFDDRVVGTCRMQALFMCGLLRAKNIPSRLRYAYCTYFVEDFNHEQVVVEYWCFNRKKWLVVDPAMNHEALSLKGIYIDFDLCDVPKDKSMPIAEAWRRCRANELSPAAFGAFSKLTKYSGLAHVRRKLYQDLACVNKIEVLEWDRWGPFLTSDEISSQEAIYCGEIASLLNHNELSDDALYDNIMSLRAETKPVVGMSISPFNGDYEIIYE